MHIIPCSKDESLLDNMITKEFKNVVVLVIVSLRGNLISYPHNNISFVQLDPKTIEKLAPKCCSWKWLLKWFICKIGLAAILYFIYWYHSWRNGTIIMRGLTCIYCICFVCKIWLIMFSIKLKILRDTLIKKIINIMYIYLKLLSIFHTIWTEMIGYMDLGPIPNRFIYMDFVYISGNLYLFI